MSILNQTILVVDDSPNNIKILSELLKDFKLKVALNGTKALQIAQSDTPPDLILLDIVMPELDGYEVCRILKEKDETKNIPVIFLTAKYEKEDVVKGFSLGAQDFISKPFDPKELMARVKTQMELVLYRKRMVKLNSWLEEIVQERTEDLIDATRELRKANKQLTELDNAKMEFLKIASHEIRTPLNGICGSMWLLKEAGHEELADLIYLLEVSVLRLERFTEKALLATDLRTNNYSPNYQDCSVSKQFKEALKYCDKEIKNKKITFRESEGLDISFNCDKNLLSVCMNEILANAVKYSEEEGEIWMRASKESENVVIEFIDQGKGFEDKVMAHLFQLLRPGEGHLDQNIGLSLAIIQMILEKLKGKIEVGNNEQNGAWVKLFFPIV